jgi:hypothetical protein
MMGRDNKQTLKEEKRQSVCEMPLNKPLNTPSKLNESTPLARLLPWQEKRPSCST